MTTTSTQGMDFADHLIKPSSLLDDALDWIRDNLSPERVFDESELEDWAKRNGFKRDEG